MRRSTAHRVQGAVRKVTGKAKQETGRITRNRSMQAGGLVEKHVGRAQSRLGKIQREVEKSSEDEDLD